MEIRQREVGGKLGKLKTAQQDASEANTQQLALLLTRISFRWTLPLRTGGCHALAAPYGNGGST